MVEQRDGAGGAYGQGRRVPMALKDFLQHMQKGGDTLYLTTQEVRKQSWLIQKTQGLITGWCCCLPVCKKARHEIYHNR